VRAPMARDNAPTAQPTAGTMEANAAFEVRAHVCTTSHDTLTVCRVQATPAYPEQAGANEYASEYVETGASEYPKQVTVLSHAYVYACTTSRLCACMCRWAPTLRARRRRDPGKHRAPTQARQTDTIKIEHVIFIDLRTRYESGAFRENACKPVVTVL
jgi:hypothetical protein